jgi:hypothetical protein
MTEEEFYERFTVIPSKAGLNAGSEYMSWDEAQNYPDNHVWTVVDSDDGSQLIAIPGYHFINRIDYMVTEQPWDDLAEEAILFTFITEDEAMQLIIAPGEEPI